MIEGRGVGEDVILQGTHEAHLYKITPNFTLFNFQNRVGSDHTLITLSQQSLCIFDKVFFISKSR